MPKIFSGEHEHGDGERGVLLFDFDEIFHKLSIVSGSANQEHNVNTWLDLSKSINIHGDLSSLASFMPILAIILPFAFLGTKSGVEGMVSANENILNINKKIYNNQSLSIAFDKALEHLKQCIDNEVNEQNKYNLTVLLNVLKAKNGIIKNRLISLESDLKNHKLDKIFFKYAMLAGSFLSYSFILQFSMKMASIANDSNLFLNILSGTAVGSAALSFLSTLFATIMGGKSVHKSSKQLKEIKLDNINIKNRFLQDLDDLFLNNNIDKQNYEEYKKIILSKGNYLSGFFKKYLTSNSVFTTAMGTTSAFLAAKLIVSILSISGIVSSSILSAGTIPAIIVASLGAIGAVAYLAGHVIQHKKQKEKEDIKYDPLFKYHQFLNLLGSNAIALNNIENLDTIDIKEIYRKLAQSTTIIHSKTLTPSKKLFEGIRALSKDIAKKENKKYKSIKYSNEKNINIFTSIKDTISMTAGAASRKIFKLCYSLTHKKTIDNFTKQQSKFAENMHYKFFRPKTINKFGVEDKLNNVVSSTQYSHEITNLLKNYLLDKQNLAKEKHKQTQLLMQVLPIVKDENNQDTININNITNIMSNEELLQVLTNSESIQNILDMAQISDEEQKLIDMNIESLDDINIRKYFVQNKGIHNIEENNVDLNKLDKNIHEYLCHIAQKEYEHYRMYTFNLERAMSRQ